MADNDGDLGSFLTGFILGGLIGAGAALLFASSCLLGVCS